MPAEIIVGFSKRIQQGGPGYYKQAIDSLSFQLALAEARWTKERMQKKGNPADRTWSGYSTKATGKYLAPNYPGARVTARSIQTRSGAIRYRSAAAMHQALRTRRGSFSPSGGMWSGLTVLSFGTRISKIVFRGRSPGQTPKWRQTKARAKKGLPARAKTYQISNALKAYSVLHMAGVNVMALTMKELDEIEAIAMDAVQNGMTGESIAAIKWPKNFEIK